MTALSYLQSDDLFYLNVFLKLLLGLLAIVLVINKSGKGNLAPTSAIDQVQNYVLGGIIGGVIYSPSVSILQFAVVLAIWALLIIGLRRLKTKNHAIKQFVDGAPIVLIKHGEVDVEACRRAKITAAEVALKLRGEGGHHGRGEICAGLSSNAPGAEGSGQRQAGERIGDANARGPGQRIAQQRRPDVAVQEGFLRRHRQRSRLAQVVGCAERGRVVARACLAIKFRPSWNRPTAAR